MSTFKSTLTFTLFRLRFPRRDEWTKAMDKQLVVGPVVHQILPVFGSRSKVHQIEACRGVKTKAVAKSRPRQPP